MESFKVYLEKSPRNPLRKDRLKRAGVEDYKVSPMEMKKLKEDWLWWALRGDLDPAHPNSPHLQDIRDRYTELLTHDEDGLTAVKYLDSELQVYLKSLQREKLGSDHEKIFEYQGIQVFLDTSVVKDDFSVGSRRYNNVVKAVKGMVEYVKDIIPLKKPRILITDLSKNPNTSNSVDGDIVYGMAGEKVIYIDHLSNHMTNVYIHEYAHWLVSQTSEGSTKLLVEAYKNLLNLYYAKMKKRKVRMEEPVRVSRKVLNNLSVKLGFPEYGTTDPDELFAVIIEKWKKLPTNAMTYKFKSLVKNIITQL
tara:strand:- start:18073 stop:18993 length:921 start_codon:yes stop_codon:yes gene_type:complete